jgi:hypothetical protein
LAATGLIPDCVGEIRFSHKPLFQQGSSDMQAKTKSAGSKVKAPSATKAPSVAKAEGTWASTIKNALKKKQGNQGPAEANAKSHAQQSFAHSKMGRANPPR